MNKLYKVGMYGGKFMPMHLGHYHCLRTASDECETVYCFLLYGGAQEKIIQLQYPNDPMLRLDYRVRQLFKVCGYFDNVIPVVLDISDCVDDDGQEDWTKEVPRILKTCGGQLDAVYGSKPKYTDYYKEAYPYSVYRCLDPEHKFINVTASALRNMPIKERKEWLA